MTPRSFWLIVIKIIGIYMLIDSVYVIPQSITPLFSAGWQGGPEVLITFIVVLVVVAIYFLVLLYTVFKTGWVIDKLHLEKDFTEEKFELNIHRSTVLSIAVIVIGGIMFIDSLSQLCRYIFIYLQLKNTPTWAEQRNPNSTWIIFHFIKTAFGYFLMTNSRFIVNIIDRQRKKESADS